MTNALETTRLGKRFGRTWALRECTFTLPVGRVAALVGPNGAGKTTLLRLAAGLLRPTVGDVEVFGMAPRTHALATLPHIGFVAQDHPLYASFSVTDMLAYGRHLNAHWDQQAAVSRLARLSIPLDQRIGRLSGGQQAQVALVMALAKRPDLVLLDEPLASLDPLARREFLAGLMDATIQASTTVLLSSHIISDLERVCDYLILLSFAQVQLAGDINDIVRTHKRLVGPHRDVAAVAAVASLHDVVAEQHSDRQTILLVRTNSQVFDPSWVIRDVSLEDIVLAYLARPQRHLPDASTNSRTSIQTGGEIEGESGGVAAAEAQAQPTSRTAPGAEEGGR
jgi:ABC-2 type transport system ATP-binding protein